MTDLKRLMENRPATVEALLVVTAPTKEDPSLEDVGRMTLAVKTLAMAEQTFVYDAANYIRALEVAAVNALPELLALREEVGRLRHSLRCIASFSLLKIDKCEIETPEVSNAKGYNEALELCRGAARAALNQEGGQ